MEFSKFRIQIAIRLVLIVITAFVLFYTLFRTDYLSIPLLLTILLIVQAVMLVSFVEKSHRNLSSFLESIRYNDFSRSFEVDGLGKSYDDLRKSFNSVIEDFQKVRMDREEQYFFLQNLIQHIGISLLAYNEEGNLIMINNAAKKLLKTKQISSVHEIDSGFEPLKKAILGLKNGEKSIVKLSDDKQLYQLAVFATEFKLSEQNIKLISVQNIQSELDEKEMESWQKLIRVLTHEIMNSITPISSVSSTISSMIGTVDMEDEALRAELLADIKEGLDTIHKRSDGLIHFVDTYRSLTKIPNPNFSVFPVARLFDHICNILGKELAEKNIELITDLRHERLEMTADEKLVQQIIINLVKNSMQALSERNNGRITLSGFMNEAGNIVITVCDNGPGILDDVLDKIFIPFFTTKPNGSGVGLSLSRQIMRLHKGSINAFSDKEKQETTFVLQF